MTISLTRKMLIFFKKILKKLPIYIRKEISECILSESRCYGKIALNGYLNNLSIDSIVEEIKSSYDYWHGVEKKVISKFGNVPDFELIVGEKVSIFDYKEEILNHLENWISNVVDNSVRKELGYYGKIISNCYSNNFSSIYAAKEITKFYETYNIKPLVINGKEIPIWRYQDFALDQLFYMNSEDRKNIRTHLENKESEYYKILVDSYKKELTYRVCSDRLKTQQSIDWCKSENKRLSPSCYL